MVSIDERPEVFLSTDATSSAVSRALAAGKLRKVGPRLYTRDLTTPLSALVESHLWDIVAAYFPRAVVSHRTAFEVAPASDRSVVVTSTASRRVSLPGLAIRAVRGPAALPTDQPFMNLFLASPARAYLENLTPSRARRGVARGLTRAEIEHRLELDLRRYGDTATLRIRDEARKIAPALALEAERRELDGIIGSLLGTRTTALTAPTASARADGTPYDDKRIELFDALRRALLDVAIPPRFEGADESSALPFFESYFSNFIEGTEFDVDDAKAIVLDRRPSTDRPADAHDITGTFAIVSDRREMSRVPRTYEGLVEILQSRHARLMEARPEVLPGRFKDKLNRAGSSEFVLPELVAGTLRRGLELANDLRGPFQRAAYMMFLVSEVHPFRDGNGRIARIMMNAELIAEGQRRIIIPTIFRSNYLRSLKALTHNGRTDPLIRSLDFAQRYTAAVDFSSYAAGKAMLEETHAFMEADYADSEGIRLVMPER